MTKGELRKARKAARAAGVPLVGSLAVDQCEQREPLGHPAVEWGETPAGYRARERWARRYDELNGAEGIWDL